MKKMSFNQCCKKKAKKILKFFTQKSIIKYFKFIHFWWVLLTYQKKILNFQKFFFGKISQKKIFENLKNDFYKIFFQKKLNAYIPYLKGCMFFKNLIWCYILIFFKKILKNFFLMKICFFRFLKISNFFKKNEQLSIKQCY